MGRGMLVAWAVAATALLGGCGTVANLALSGTPPAGPMKVYGGVQRDLDIVHDCTTNPDHPRDNAEAVCFAAAVTVAAVDLPFSAVADTFTLPVTIPVALVTQGRTDKPPQPGSGPTPAGNEADADNIRPGPWIRSGGSRP
jgi:uncharacterized protein YceK